MQTVANGHDAHNPAAGGRPPAEGDAPHGLAPEALAMAGRRALRLVTEDEYNRELRELWTPEAAELATGDPTAPAPELELYPGAALLPRREQIVICSHLDEERQCEVVAELLGGIPAGELGGAR